MRRVVLIGDSIRIGYQAAVECELTGRAEVWAPGENGGTSENVLAHLDEWVIARRPDIVHLNCGLHDLRIERGRNERAVPLPQYRVNLNTIFRRIRDESNPVIIWATTTPVNERWHRERKDFDRRESDVDAYNQAAGEVANRMDIPINDLYAVVMEHGRDAILSPDGVHYSEAGYDLLGRAVAEAIRAQLELNG